MESVAPNAVSVFSNASLGPVEASCRVTVVSADPPTKPPMWSWIRSAVRVAEFGYKASEWLNDLQGSFGRQAPPTPRHI